MRTGSFGTGVTLATSALPSGVSARDQLVVCVDAHAGIVGHLHHGEAVGDTPAQEGATPEKRHATTSTAAEGRLTLELIYRQVISTNSILRTDLRRTAI